jgi:glutamate dehydrogenase/leucine dehydrogenase
VVDKLFRILESAFTQTLNLSRKQKISMRLAALSLGVRRVQEAKRTRGLSSVATTAADSSAKIFPLHFLHL